VKLYQDLPPSRFENNPMAALHGYFLAEKREECLQVMSRRLLSAEMYDMDRGRQFRRLSKTLGPGHPLVDKLAGDLIARYDKDEWVIRPCAKHLLSDPVGKGGDLVEKRLLADGLSVKGRIDLLQAYVDCRGLNATNVQRIGQTALSKAKEGRIAGKPHFSLGVLILFPTPEAEAILDGYVSQMTATDSRTYDEATAEVAREAVKLRLHPPSSPDKTVKRWMEMIREDRGYCSEYLLAALPQIVPDSLKTGVIEQFRAPARKRDYGLRLAELSAIRALGGTLTPEESSREKKEIERRAKDE